MKAPPNTSLKKQTPSSLWEQSQLDETEFGVADAPQKREIDTLQKGIGPKDHHHEEQIKIQPQTKEP